VTVLFAYPNGDAEAYISQVHFFQRRHLETKVQATHDLCIEFGEARLPVVVEDKNSVDHVGRNTKAIFGLSRVLETGTV
jgi:hypothetical protein